VKGTPGCDSILTHQPPALRNFNSSTEFPGDLFGLRIYVLAYGYEQLPLLLMRLWGSTAHCDEDAGWEECKLELKDMIIFNQS
jgi:hypothetical protein